MGVDKCVCVCACIQRYKINIISSIWPMFFFLACFQLEHAKYGIKKNKHLNERNSRNILLHLLYMHRYQYTMEMVVFASWFIFTLSALARACVCVYVISVYFRKILKAKKNFILNFMFIHHMNRINTHAHAHNP